VHVGLLERIARADITADGDVQGFQNLSECALFKLRVLEMWYKSRIRVVIQVVCSDFCSLHREAHATLLVFMFDQVRNQMITAITPMLHKARITATGQVKNAPRS
jgi:hypothetical protein